MVTVASRGRSLEVCVQAVCFCESKGDTWPENSMNWPRFGDGTDKAGCVCSFAWPSKEFGPSRSIPRSASARDCPQNTAGILHHTRIRTLASPRILPCYGAGPLPTVPWWLGPCLLAVRACWGADLAQTLVVQSSKLVFFRLPSGGQS